MRSSCLVLPVLELRCGWLSAASTSIPRRRAQSWSVGSVAHAAPFALGTCCSFLVRCSHWPAEFTSGRSGASSSISPATLEVTTSLLLARYGAAYWVKQKAGTRLDRLIKGVEAEGWRLVALTRPVPLFPFNSLNELSWRAPVSKPTSFWCSDHAANLSRLQCQHADRSRSCRGDEAVSPRSLRQSVERTLGGRGCEDCA